MLESLANKYGILAFCLGGGQREQTKKALAV